MIERLLAGEAALARDELDAAERLFLQVADADRRNAIAVVGLARVAQRRNDTIGARALASRALGIDPDEAAATRLLAELEQTAAPAPPARTPPERVVPVPTERALPRRGWRGFLDRILRPR